MLMVSILIVIANLIILGLNLKLYTEYFKDKAARARSLNDDKQIKGGG